MNANSAFDASIPVLTEVFDDQAEASVPAPARAPELRHSAPAALEQRAITDWSAADWTQLEHRLSERILHQLQGRVDFVLEQRLRDSMEDVLKHALAGLSAQIQQGLQQTIEQIVLRAVAQELAHLQAQKK